jgi:hypothetical protein
MAAGMPVPKKRLARQADHGVEQVLLDQLLADAPLGPAAEEHAVRHDHAHAAVAFGRAVSIMWLMKA